MNIETTKNLHIDYNKRNGLIPVIVQDNNTKEILMLAYANEEDINKSKHSLKATFYSTSRKKLWTKGETSGNYMEIVDIYIDCDQDAMIYKVILKGDGACHTKDQSDITRKSCFYRKLKKQNNIFTNTLEFN